MAVDRNCTIFHSNFGLWLANLWATAVQTESKSVAVDWVNVPKGRGWAWSVHVISVIYLLQVFCIKTCPNVFLYFLPFPVLSAGNSHAALKSHCAIHTLFKSHCAVHTLFVLFFTWLIFTSLLTSSYQSTSTTLWYKNSGHLACF